MAASTDEQRCNLFTGAFLEVRIAGSKQSPKQMSGTPTCLQQSGSDMTRTSGAGANVK